MSCPLRGTVYERRVCKQIDGVVSFLSGNDKKIHSLLQQKMQNAAENEDFELAIFYRKNLKFSTNL